MVDGPLSSIIVALIAGGFSVIGQLVISNRKTKEQEIRDAVRDQKIDDRLARIEENQTRQEKKLDEHNGWGEKFSDTSKSLAILQKDVEYLKKSAEKMPA